MVSGGVQMTKTGNLNPLMRAIHTYRGNADGLAKIIDAAGRAGILELQKAGLSLRKLVGAEGKGVSASRFGTRPPEIYPSKGTVVGNLLASLSLSQNPNVQALASELAVAWFKDVAKEIPIYGKYVG